MGLEGAVTGSQEAWSLAPSPEPMAAASLLICRMGEVSPSLDPRRPFCQVGGWVTWLQKESPGVQTSLAGSTLLESVSAISSLWEPGKASPPPVERMSLAVRS